MTDFEIEEIIRDCQKQKVEAQEKLYKLFYESMFRVCISYAKDKDLAKDFLQDGFIKVFRNIKQYQFRGSFEGWMKRLFIHNILDDFKKNNVLNNASNEDVSNISMNSSINAGESNLGIENILSIMNYLPNKTRVVFMLFVVDGFSHKEIAEKLEISTETSKWHVKEARAFFKKNYSTLRK